MSTTTNPVTVDAPQGLPHVHITREFDAPVAAVFRANCDPELVKQWLGPHGYDMKIDTYDVTTGGRYRYIHRDPEGNEYAFRGVFHSVDENASIVQTMEFEGFPGEVSLEKMTITDLGGGRCRVEGRSTFGSVETRDAMVDSGMETGVTEGYERLDDLLAKQP